MKISASSVKEVILRILTGQDHRQVVLSWLDEAFLAYCLDLFKAVVTAKLDSKTVDLDWYRRAFVDNDALKPDDRLTYSGLNQKTITNTYGNGRRDTKIRASLEHYDELQRVIKQLVESADIDVKLTIEMKGVAVELSLSESLLVVNAMAVKRASLRGGAWSSLGKTVELPLMITLAHLFKVPSSYYRYKTLTNESREVDFVFVSKSNSQIFCEVKLMGQGNPESADAVYGRDSKLLIGHTLSELNKQQLTARGYRWIELRHNGFYGLYDVLYELQVPSVPLDPNLPIEDALDQVMPSIVEEIRPFFPDY